MTKVVITVVGQTIIRCKMDIVFSTINNQFLNMWEMCNENYRQKLIKDVGGFFADTNPYNPKHNNTANFLKHVIGGNVYVFITAAYQHIAFEEALEKYDSKKYRIYQTEKFGNLGHPSHKDHLIMHFIHFPEDYEYVE